MSIRILLADDHRLFREGLQSLLKEEADMEVVAFLPHSSEVMDSGMRTGGIAAVLDGPVGDEMRKLQSHLKQEIVAARE